MKKDCKMRKFCEKSPKDFLRETAGLIGSGRIETETIKLYRDRLEELRRKQKTPNFS